MKSSINKRAPWEERGGARLHHQLGRKEEDLALFQDMRIRESSANCSPSSLDPSSPLDHLHASGKFRGAPLGRNDLLTSEMDKSDYDWLLTPPGTPLFPSLDRDYLIPSPSSNSSNNNTNNNNTPRDSSSASRKLSRLSTPAQQLLVSSSSSGSSISSASKLYSRGSNPSPVRRQSAPLLSTSTNTPSSGMKQRPTPNPSTTGSRPSTPTRRPSSAPSPTPAIAAPRRSSTPTRTPPSTSSSRPSTPTRTPSSATSSFTSLSSSSSSARPSTPTRRSPNPISPGTSLTNGRFPSSRGTSPVRRPAPDRALSTSMSSNASTVAAAMNPSSSTGHLNRSFNHHLDRGSVGGDHHPHQHLGFSRRAVTSTNDLQLPKSSDNVRKPAAKFCGGSRETSFFGTSISKKSIDTAIRHMDIRRSSPGGFRAPPPAATATYPKSTRSQIHQQSNHQSNNNHHLNHYHQEMPDYSRLMSGEDKPVNGLFEHVQDAMDDSFLLEFNSLTASSEATFLEGADYLKDP